MDRHGGTLPSRIKRRNDNVEEMRDYLEAVRRSWNEHEELLIAKIPKFVDLKKDSRLRNAHIILCNKCLIVYPDEDLEKVGDLLYCKTTEETPRDVSLKRARPHQMKHYLNKIIRIKENKKKKSRKKHQNNQELETGGKLLNK